MPEKWRKLRYVRNCRGQRNSFRRSVSVGIPCFRALHFADSTGFAYAILTEVDNCEGCSGKSAKVACGNA